MDEYVEKMIKDKFLLNVMQIIWLKSNIKTARTVEVLKPDIDHLNYDFALSCNGIILFLKLFICNDKDKKKDIKFKDPKWFSQGVLIIKIIVDDVDHTNIVEYYSYDLNTKTTTSFLSTRTLAILHPPKRKKTGKHDCFRKLELKEIIQEFYKLNILNEADEIENVHQHSTYIEKISTYAFIEAIREHAWLKEDQTKIEVLYGLVDKYGYDLVLRFENKKKEIAVRYVQCKSTKNASQPQPIHNIFNGKEGGCVIWQIRQMIDVKADNIYFDYFFFGGQPSDKLNLSGKKVGNKTSIGISSFVACKKKSTCKYHYDITYNKGVYIQNVPPKEKDKKSARIEKPDSIRILFNLLSNSSFESSKGLTLLTGTH